MKNRLLYAASFAAHDNVFNRAILNDQALYFSTPGEVKNIINEPSIETIVVTRKNMNIERIKKIYNWENIINDYEQVLKKAIEKRKRSI